MNCRPSPARAAEAAPHEPQERVEDAARDPGSSSSPSAARPSACAASIASSNARSHARATSMLNRQVSGASGSSPPRMPVASSFGGVVAMGVDRGGARLQPDARRPLGAARSPARRRASTSHATP